MNELSQRDELLERREVRGVEARLKETAPIESIVVQLLVEELVRPDQVSVRRDALVVSAAQLDDDWFEGRRSDVDGLDEGHAREVVREDGRPA